MSAQTIQVKLIESGTGKILADAPMPVNVLPKDFEARTTITWGDDQWAVEKAEPIYADDFIQTGKLTLIVWKMKVPSLPADLDKIYYSRPTIGDPIPAVDSNTNRKGKNIFVIDDDNWRNVEFVSREYEKEIDSQLSEIGRVIREQSKKIGQFWAYRETYIRDKIKNPIVTSLSFGELVSTLPINFVQYDGIGYEGFGGQIIQGFAFRSNRLVIYGQQSNGVIVALGLERILDAAVISESLFQAQDVTKSFENIMSKNDLYLIDWLQRKKIRSDANALVGYLKDYLDLK